MRRQVRKSHSGVAIRLTALPIHASSAAAEYRISSGALGALGGYGAFTLGDLAPQSLDPVLKVANGGVLELSFQRDGFFGGRGKRIVVDHDANL
jgi:hypothetical protein